jgi:hypothetical protein
MEWCDHCAALVMRKVAETVTQRGQSKPPKGLARFIELANMKLDRPLDRLFGEL